MTTYAWPTTNEFVPQTFQAGAVERIAESVSPYTGGRTTGEIPFSYRRRYSMAWAPAVDFAVQARRVAFVMKIRRSHRVLIPNFAFARNAYAPFGTLRGSPVVAAQAAQGATTIAITTSTAGQTLLAGDEVGFVTSIGTQVVTAVANATAAGTAMTLTFEPPLRATVSAASAVTWSRPTPRFILASAEWSASFRPKEAQPIALDFLEDW